MSSIGSITLPLTLTALLLAESASPHDVEIRLIHSKETSDAATDVLGCADCETIQVRDGVDRIDKVVVPRHPDLEFSLSSVRAALAVSGPNAKASQTILILDGPTRTEFMKFRSRSDISRILISIDGQPRSVGRLHTLSMWEVDAGFLGEVAELTELFGDSTTFRVLISDGEHQESEVECKSAVSGALSNEIAGRKSNDKAHRQPGDSAASARGPADSTDRVIWAQGAVRGGRKHGLWTLIDDRSEVVRLEWYQNACLLAVIEPRR